jgi:ribosome biogenesis GTPase / thiamine phosphate phosphatase
MAPGEKPRKPGKKVRVPFRRNRAEPPRDTGWTRKAREADDYEFDSEQSESVVAKGKLSRQRTIIVRDEEDHGADSRRGRVLAVRGLYAEVDDGEQVWPCTIRRVLRTRQIDERNPVTVGDKVRFAVDARGGAEPKEGVIVEVDPRKGELKRRSGRRTHTMVANVDQAIIVSSARQPLPRPNLIDRYIVAAHFGGITPIVCMNKIDLAEDDLPDTLLDRYTQLGYRAVAASTVTGEGVEELRNILKDKESVLAGQSGVGKSSLLNAVQPGLGLKVGKVAEQSEKGRHTTTTATLIRLEMGGYVVDTPGIRAFDLTLVPAGELEAYFVEFVPHVAGCKFPDCTHTHETACAIKAAVERGEIDPERYESYLHIFEDPGAPI